MKHRLGSGQMALLLVVACALLRIAAHFNPAFLPGFTPFTAFAFVAAAYLPSRWSWLLGVAALLLSEAAFLPWNMTSEGHFFSAMLLISLGFYALMGGLGILLPRRTLGLLFAGPIAGSIFFYVIANTYSWWSSSYLAAPMAYPQTWAGWVQANTTGLPGYAPAWAYLRNGLAADVLFTVVLIAIFEPSLLSGAMARGEKTVRA